MDPPNRRTAGGNPAFGLSDPWSKAAAVTGETCRDPTGRRCGLPVLLDTAGYRYRYAMVLSRLQCLEVLIVQVETAAPGVCPDLSAIPGNRGTTKGYRYKSNLDKQHEMGSG